MRKKNSARASEVEENRRLLSGLELPECEGPKLKAFPHRDSPITWLECISHTNMPLLGGQGYVFKVEIKSRIYALKVFKFFKPSRYRDSLGPIFGQGVTDVELGFHTDPFYAECRAYAHIEARRKKQGLKRKDIADCYGFMALTKADEEVLEEYGIDLWCDIPPGDEYRMRAEGSPVRALVKEYIEEDVEMDEKTRKHLIAAIKWMNRNQIRIHDIHPGNFKGGYLLDLGLAWTKPHCLWRSVSRQRMPALLTVDLVRFEEMIDEMGFGTKNRLRSSPETSSEYASSYE
ncbi:kinetochore Sim4 complex subunit FTA2-domain-containing protein [Xylaria cf. heliscus]|nr:kinetochore Sim4 complex subunit FTA2-domain-containing protein [Xylaria cf. heliscus]